MVWLDNNECLLKYDFSKITCGKGISGDVGYQDYSRGRHAKEIFKIEFNQLMERLDLQSSEDQFLLYLEWDALRSSIAQYYGLSEEVDTKRYKISSINFDENGVEIRQIINPPAEMPKKIISCRARSSEA